MADTKISGLTAVTDVQDTDEFVLARAGTTKKIDAVDLLGAIGVWQSFTPTLQGASGNPSLGSSPTQAGRYTQIGDTIIGSAIITLGSGATAGTGQTFLVLPVAPRRTESLWYGNGIIYDSDATNSYVFMLATQGSGSQAGMWIHSGDVGLDNAYLAPGTPFTIAASDQMKFWFAYEAA